MKTSMVLTGEG